MFPMVPEHASSEILYITSDIDIKLGIYSGSHKWQKHKYMENKSKTN